ncbi:hypothetical protein [Salisaeta longa]|uniref:hypothetical protein n=1 Tax=Salisaeta longa TaxID=503170 RepID=UPI0003B6E900|nr:hypothetical protein [Salisaeta longa]
MIASARIAALLLEPISRYATRSTYDEMHLAVEPKPMGAERSATASIRWRATCTASAA